MKAKEQFAKHMASLQCRSSDIYGPKDDILIAYETNMLGPFNKKEWGEQKNLLQECYKNGMFNKIIIWGPTVGFKVPFIEDEKTLDSLISDIDKGFKREPNKGVQYLIGLNLKKVNKDKKGNYELTPNISDKNKQN